MDRFWDKVKKTSTCWIWTGAKTGNGGLSVTISIPTTPQEEEGIMV